MSANSSISGHGGRSTCIGRTERSRFSRRRPLKDPPSRADAHDMKPITLHPLSVLAGLVLAGVAVLLAGAAAQTPIPTKTLFVGEVPAEWWTYVELRTAPDGTPTDSYTIPVNRHFV